MSLHDTRTFTVPRTAQTWPAARVNEARAVIADMARHSDPSSASPVPFWSPTAKATRSVATPGRCCS
jgi:hypothetical protein